MESTFMGTTDAAAARLPTIGGGWDKRNAIIASSAFDLAGVAAFFFTALALIARAKKMSALADANTVTIHDYTVWVHGLPADAGKEEVTQHFEQYGPVAAVELLHANADIVGRALSRGALLRRLEAQRGALQRDASKGALDAKGLKELARCATPLAGPHPSSVFCCSPARPSLPNPSASSLAWAPRGCPPAIPTPPQPLLPTHSKPLPGCARSWRMCTSS